MRPFDSSRDLHALGRLLEEAFRSEHTFLLSDLPVLRELGVFLWMLSYAPVFPDNITGFVWIEDGEMVGNVTLSLDESRTDRFLVSNVAVKPAYQRRGIAKALMQTALDHLRSRGAKWVLLNVRPHNAAAVQLYRDLSFVELNQRGEWKRVRAVPRPSSSFDRFQVGAESAHFRPLRVTDRRAVSHLMQAATPAAAQDFRSPYMVDFQFDAEDPLADITAQLVLLQMTRRWVLEVGDRLTALVTVRGRPLAGAHRLDLLVHPNWRGLIEKDLVAFALQQVGRFPARGVHAVVTGAYPELIAALEQEEFEFVNGLMLMALAL